jgi:hypothetical protein
MGDRPSTWSGDDWQDYCDLLFQERHKPAGYQRVPDKDRGDLGVEGFTVDGTGCIYQCYSTEAVGGSERYRAQRDKITRDLKKLAKNRDRLEGLFGQHVMRTWILVVPEHDTKDLVEHARKKEVELRQAGLPFLSPDVTVVIQTDVKNFAIERRALEDAAAATITVAPEIGEVEASEAVLALKTNDAAQVAVMDEKLAKVLAPDTAVDVRDRMLRQSVDGANIREHLRGSHPLTLERVLRQHQIEARDLLDERDFGQLHKGSITEVRARYEKRLRDSVPGLGDVQSSRLSHAAVADWVMECPIDFEGASA